MKNNRIGVIVLCGDQFSSVFWPSYLRCEALIEHDLIIVHRDGFGLIRDIENKNGKVVFLNKIVNGEDVPYRAFGAYRYTFNKFQDKYDKFVFISDDVILKRDGWLKDISDTLDIHDKLGFGASQIFNGNKKYPHESHLRAPFWFAKAKALKETKWEFNHDHVGEMLIGDQLTKAGYFGVQVGNKINLGYDALEAGHITTLLELYYSPESYPFGKITGNCFQSFEDRIIESQFEHIGKQRVLFDLEPFDKLIYYPSLDIARQYVNVSNTRYDSFVVYV